MGMVLEYIGIKNRETARRAEIRLTKMEN